MEAFKLFSFPFFCKYFQSIEIASENLVTDSTDEMIKSFTNTLEKLLDKINNQKAVIEPSIDNHIQRFSFENDHPFFTWSSLEYPLELKQFLSGNKTTLYADVLHSKLNAVKFCTLFIKIEIKSNKFLNESLNALLNQMFVELAHPGISKYKINQEVYTINLHYNSVEKLLLRYRYGSTSDANESFRKLAENVPMLSPYTFWELKLVPIRNDDQKRYFDELMSIMKSGEEVIISLIGKGQYVTKSFFTEKFNCRVKRASRYRTCTFAKSYGKSFTALD